MKKILFTLAFIISSALIAEELPSFEIVEDQCTLVVETPDLAKQELRKLRLENGLEAVLISDPDTHQSGAALAVAVGSWDDPQDRPGMAHFVEHLLFLGTEKYPDEEGYTRFLDEHGGTRNAFTMADRTVYMFSVNNNGFLGALDRFGQFFIAPLFNPSGVERECKAIHQEYCKDLPLDPWRVLYVKKELANKNHPFHSFSIGNRDTLANISQDELKEWYKKHYSANLMHLVIYSPLDLDTLEKEVVSLFSPIENQNNPPSSCPEQLLNPSNTPKLCAITPVQDLQLLDLSWEIPRFYGQDKAVHADKLLSHVLGHEGSTSLLAQLKRENLAESLGSGTFRAGHDQCLFTLSIQLTSKGVQEYEKVIQRCYESLASIQKSGVPRYIFDEVCQLERLQFRFQSRQEIFQLVSDYAMGMVDEPIETYPQQTLIPSVYNPEKIQALLTHLTPQNCQYTLIAHPELTAYKPTVKEQWLGVEYSLVPISERKIKQWAQVSAHKSISIPRPNPFVPTNLSINQLEIESQNLIPKPSLIADEDLGKVYAAEDQKFLIPEVNWHFTIKTPEISDADPMSHVFADLYCHTVHEQLNATSYEAMLAGLIFSLQPKHGALELSIKGYSDKAQELLQTVVQTMKTAVPSQEQFTLYYELLARDYMNTLNVTPLKQGGDVLWGILFKDFSGLQRKSIAIQNAKYAQMQGFCHTILNQCYIEATLYGNQSEQQAKNAWNSVKQSLNATAYPKENHPKLEIATLPSKDHPAYLTMKSQHPANALILTTDCGHFSFKRRAAQEILTKGLEEPFFSELRTKQQTAYIVSNWSQEIERHLYNFFAIQSSSHDTRDLLARFELFIESSLQHLTDKVVPQDRFESIRHAQIHQLKHPVESLAKMGGLLHTLAFQYDGDFEWLDKRIQAFEELSYEEFVDYAQEFLGKENVRRLAVCINGALPQKGRISYREVTTPAKLRSEISYEGRQ